MKKYRESELLNLLMIIPGLAFCILGYNMFLIPNDIAAGGFIGIAQLVNSGTGWPVGVISMCLNVPLFLFTLKSLGLKFGIRSLLTTIAFSVLLDLLPRQNSINDIWLSTVYGGLLTGLGFGLIHRGSATTGGTDMLASVIHWLIPAIRVSLGIFIVDAMVIIASAFVFDTITAMYALISISISNLVVDFVLEGPSSSHSFFIVSNKSDEIAQRIMSELERGVTGLNGIGMFSGCKKQVLFCVVTRMETVLLRRIVFSVDPHAFMTSTRASDSYGEGFKKIERE